MKRVRISDFKAHLSQFLAAVRKGDTIVVLDRNTPVARVLPAEQPRIMISPATAAPSPLPPSLAVPPRKPVSSQDLLEALRGER